MSDLAAMTERLRIAGFDPFSMTLRQCLVANEMIKERQREEMVAWHAQQRVAWHAAQRRSEDSGEIVAVPGSVHLLTMRAQDTPEEIISELTDFLKSIPIRNSRLAADIALLEGVDDDFEGAIGDDYLF